MFSRHNSCTCCYCRYTKRCIYVFEFRETLNSRIFAFISIFHLMLCFCIDENISIKSVAWILIIYKFFDLEIILSKIINIQLLRLKHFIKQSSLTKLSVVNHFFNVEICACNAIYNDESRLHDMSYSFLCLILCAHHSLRI